MCSYMRRLFGVQILFSFNILCARLFLSPYSLFGIPIHRAFSARFRDCSGSSGDLSARSGELSERSRNLPPRLGDLSERSGDLSAGSGDLSPRSGDLSAGLGELSPRSGDLSGRRIYSPEPSIYSREPFPELREPSIYIRPRRITGNPGATNAPARGEIQR